MTTTLKKTAAATALAFAAALTLSACDDEGPAEKLGESIDNSAEQVGEAVEEAGEDVQDAAN